MRRASRSPSFCFPSRKSPTRPTVVEWNLRPTVYREGFATALGDAALAAGAVPYPVHVKVNTGMHRVGAEPLEAFPLVRQVAADDRLSLEGLWTHLAVAEEDPAYTTGQLDALDQFRSHAGGRGHRCAHGARGEYRRSVRLSRRPVRSGPGWPRHLRTASCTRVGARGGATAGDESRFPGGARATPSRRGATLLRQASPARGVIARGDGAHWVRRRCRPPALVRRRRGTDPGRRYPFAGTVTMDQIVIDVGEGPVAVGDEVVLLGAQGEEEITADEWAERLDTINYEIVCDFGPRLPRRYRKARST